MKQDRQQELHFEDLAKQFTEDISRSKRIFSMEDAMQDNTMRKSVQKHRRKMKRKTVLEYAIAFSAIAFVEAVKNTGNFAMLIYLV